MSTITPSTPLIINEGFEDLVIACMYRLNDFASVASLHLKPSHFGSPMRRNLCKLAVDFWGNYRCVVKGLALTHEIANLVNTKVIQKSEAGTYGGYILKLYNLDISGSNWVLSKLIEFIKHAEFKTIIQDAVSKHLPKNDFEAIEKSFVASLAITSMPSPEPYAFLDKANIEARCDRRLHAATHGTPGISTGIPEMDRNMSKGGWYRKELYVIMAPPKRGKTMSLLWFATQAAMKKFNVLFFTLETATEVLVDRMDAMVTKIDTNMLTANAIIVKNNTVGNCPWEGQVYFFEYPTKTCTVAEISRQVEKFSRTSGKLVDMVVVDYGDLVKAAVRRENKLDEQAAIFEDLRGLAGKYSIPVLTATQVNRAGTGKEITDGTDVAGSFEKIMVADEIINLSATKSELMQDHLRIGFTESRNSGRKSFVIKTNYAVGTFFKEFVKDE